MIVTSRKAMPNETPPVPKIDGILTAILRKPLILQNISIL
ncbi:hypothetical protein PUR_34380 [Paenibacillus sp. URB8-2]|nr:hypothetical protein PUR_34380 [Paenibacillus sp. URB8-2]